MRPVLIALSSVMMAASPATAEAAPPPPIPCSDPSPPPDIPYEVQLRRQLPIELTPETTFEQVTAALGPLHAFGPGREMFVRDIDVSEELRMELWLSFESAAPRRLIRALLHSYDRPHCMFSTMSILVNVFERTRSRRQDQLDYSRRLSTADVYELWGPPDDEFGSGFQFWAYEMADGAVVTLLFDQGYVLGSGDRRRRR